MLLNELTKEKIKELPLPKSYKEFYPKNYTKKSNPAPIKLSLENPLNKKETPLFYPKSYKQKNKFNDNKIQNKYEEDSEDDYSGLASKNIPYPKKEKKQKNFTRFSEDYNDFKTKWKTEICHYWEMYGTCKYGNTCAFAHGTEELNKRKMSSNYKTKLCKQFFELGYCAYGVRCQFSHKKLKEPQKEEENKISYTKILNEFNDNNNLISHEIIKRPRLMTFEDITKSAQEIKEKNRLALYEDILEIKKKENEDPERVFSEETNDENSISNYINNLLDDDNEEKFFEFNIDDYTYDKNSENKEEKRERFISE